MAHPFNEKRAHKVDRERVSRIAGHSKDMTAHVAKHRATGGEVSAPAPAKKALRNTGGQVKVRADKAVRRAKGGKVGKKGHTQVNVIVAPSGKSPMGAPAAPATPPAAAAPPMPPRPMPAAPPPGANAAPGLGGMPPMPPRKRGGRVGTMKGDQVGKFKGEHIEHDGPKPSKGYSQIHGKRASGGKVDGKYAGRTSKMWGAEDIKPAQTKLAGKKHDDFGAADMNAAKNITHGSIYGNSNMKGYKKGGKVEGKKSLADKAGRDGVGIGERTPIQHSGNKSDTQNIGRGPVITKATGGPIYADGREGKEMGPNLHAGANSGVGRRAKNHLAKAQHWEA